MIYNQNPVNRKIEFEKKDPNIREIVWKNSRSFGYFEHYVIVSNLKADQVLDFPTSAGTANLTLDQLGMYFGKRALVRVGKTLSSWACM